ncbi:uncharacterized protein PG998_010060 [Apiospora kogelbergensis]|uniref:uncharacterized protein n=1 Tax=Apiospora kogelbergensis TaxID=1337665 RepID=UPI00312DC130
MRRILQSITNGHQDMDFKEAAQSVILDRPLSDTAFEAFLAVMANGVPITPDELRVMCLHEITTKSKLRAVYDSYDFPLDQKLTLAEAIENIIKKLSSSYPEWRNMTQRESLYFELVEEIEGFKHPLDVLTLASRCNPATITQLNLWISNLRSSPQMNQIGAWLKSGTYNSGCPYHQATLVNQIQSLGAKERNTLMYAADNCFEQVSMMSRCTTRNFYNAVTNTWEHTSPADKKKRDIQMAKAAVKKHVAKYGNNGSVSHKVEVDLLLQDLERVCCKWEPNKFLTVPDKLFSIHVGVIIDVHNGMMEFARSKGCEPLGDRVRLGVV